MKALLILAALPAVAIGIVAMFVKAPRTMLMLAVILSASVSARRRDGERRRRLRHVTDALQVRRIVYANEESWGFGPGGNEAGIVVYALPDRVAENVEAGGLAYLTNLPPNVGRRQRDWRGHFTDWKPTPIEPGPHWMPEARSGRYDIYRYICAYGFCIDIDERFEREAERTRRVFFMYNG